MDRRRFAREDQKAVALRVAGEVDEDVDAVLANLLGEVFVGHVERVAPMDRIRLQSLRHRVGTINVRIAENLETGSIVMSEKGFDEKCDGVFFEVGRDVRDSQGAGGGAVVGAGIILGEGIVFLFQPGGGGGFRCGRRR